MTDARINQAVENAVSILRGNLPDFTYSFQASNSENNFYPPSGNTEWTTGFCTGQYWLAYEHTGDEAFRRAALIQVESFFRRVTERIDIDHHDMGFLYTPSCVAAFKLTKSETGKKAALLAADQLLRRFHEKGGFIQAWGALNDPGNYRLIIDCLLNLPLLYWASDITGKPEYREKAVIHTQTSLKNLVREDNSTFHTFFFDTETGKPLRGVTHQGRRDGSAWARGQAWGVYGLALAYKYTRDKTCVELFKRVADFFINRLPAGLIPYWDLDFTDSDREPVDSSAAAIAVCGMLEMAKYLPDEDASRYMKTARKITDALYERCAVKESAVSNGLLLHGVYAKSTDENPVSDRGVDECNTWGDYFWLELLTRLSKEWDTYW